MHSEVEIITEQLIHSMHLPSRLCVLISKFSQDLLNKFVRNRTIRLALLDVFVLTWDKRLKELLIAGLA